MSPSSWQAGAPPVPPVDLATVVDHDEVSGVPKSAGGQKASIPLVMGFTYPVNIDILY